MTTPRKRQPLRSCIACGAKSAKRDLLRIVATAQSKAALDLTGKSPGRGAYICGHARCTDQGLKRGRVEHALRKKLDEEEWTELIDEIETFRLEQSNDST